jgi:hypothetical protein
MTARPTYESADDRAGEWAAVDAAFGPLGLRCVKLPRAYEVDFGVLRGDVLMGVCEVKVRSRAYETVMLSLHKAQALRRFAREGMRAWLLLSLPTGLYARRIAPDEQLDVRLGGRADRGDWQDIEPAAHFPVVGMARVAC